MALWGVGYCQKHPWRREPEAKNSGGGDRDDDERDLGVGGQAPF